MLKAILKALVKKEESKFLMGLNITAVADTEDGEKILKTIQEAFKRLGQRCNRKELKKPLLSYSHTGVTEISLGKYPFLFQYVESSKETIDHNIKRFCEMHTGIVPFEIILMEIDT